LTGSCRSDRHDEVVEDLSAEGATVEPAEVYAGDRLATVHLETRSVDGRKAVRFELRNVSGDDLDGYWAVDWFDRAGSHLAPAPRKWTRIALEPGAARAIEIRSPDSKADSWRLCWIDASALP
jgi:hypothetical protein